MSVAGSNQHVTNGTMTERREVVIVGGGQAGLAIGYFLSREGLNFTILEAAEEPAAAWRERWDSLQLFTSARYDALPGLPFPGDPGRYPTRDEVAAYLTDYARHFELPVELNSRVRSIRKTNGTYLVELDDRTYEADQVVVATGPFQVPLIPPVAERLDSGVMQLHSSRYRAPGALPDGPVLVVGGGNTGFQIAEELSASREVHLSIGSRQTPLPQRILGRDLFWYLDATGLIRKTTESRVGRRMQGRDTLIGSSPRGLRRGHGVELHGRTVDAEGSTVSFSDGTRLEVRSVVWATGFRVDHSWIDAPVFGNDGLVRHRRGVTESPGLYFLGLTWQHTRGSALLGWVKDDARYIADQIGAARATKPSETRTQQETDMSTTPEHFPTETAGLPEARATDTVDLSDGDQLDLRIAPVTKQLGDAKVRMLAYNGSIPGPTLKVKEGAEVVVNVENQGDMEATVHWHGLRLENRYDGTHETQEPMAVGERFSARVAFPDPGLYWYHPHIREDYGQEMGLYGNVSVREVAKRAGVSPGAPFRHFSNKTALMTAVAEQAMSRFRLEITNAVDNVATDDPIERFAAVGVAYLRWAIRNPTHFQIISTRSLIDWDSSESLRRDNEAVRVLMEDAMVEAQRRSMLRSNDIADTQIAGRALVYGLARMAIDGHFAQWATAGQTEEQTTHNVLRHFVSLIGKDERRSEP